MSLVPFQAFTYTRTMLCNDYDDNSCNYSKQSQVKMSLNQKKQHQVKMSLNQKKPRSAPGSQSHLTFPNLLDNEPNQSQPPPVYLQIDNTAVTHPERISSEDSYACFTCGGSICTCCCSTCICRIPQLPRLSLGGGITLAIVTTIIGSVAVCYILRVLTP